MPRIYEPQPRRTYHPNSDDYRERGGSNKKNHWNWIKYVGIGIGIIIILLITLSATGNLKGSNDTTINTNNTQTAEPTQYEQITTYILAQQAEGLDKEEIIQRLTLAGFTTEEIETSYKLSDPIVQQILQLEKEGKTRQQIVEILLDQKIAPEEIQARLNLIDDINNKKVNIKGNIIWIILGIVALYFVIKTMRNDEEAIKRMPKVYTLDECEEYAREYLDKKNKEYIPTKQYRNRPDLRQYRFIYEEPLYAEFNDHRPTGNKIGRRIYYLIAIGYDKEVIDYLETQDDNKPNTFLYAAPKGFESSGSKEYMDMRGRSEQPIEENKNTNNHDYDYDHDQYYNQRTTPYRKRTTPYNRPGPVGWERE